MKIIVCIKQVPEVADIRFDPETKTIIREGVPSAVNPFDRRALAEAIRLREKFGGEVVVVTMGPAQARDALVNCLGAGADRALHLLDRAFAGSDTLATARTLALALAKEKYDLILCGKYSVNAETGQVGPELAEILDIPHVTGATKLEISEDRRSATVERETDDGFETIEVDLPALLTASERLVRPIKVKEPQIEAGRAKPVEEISAINLSSDLSIFGSEGSPTWVTEIRSLARTREVEFIGGATADEKASRLIEHLTRRGALIKGGARPTAGIAPETPSDFSSDREVWAVAELIDGRLRPVSLELLGKGIEIARKLGAQLAAFVAGADASNHAKTLAEHGADKVYVAEDARLAAYTTTLYTSLLAGAVQKYSPVVVLLPSTSNGRDLAPRLAARLAVGLTADCIDLDVNEREELVQHKPAFGGNIVALILSRTLPQVATVKPGMLRPATPNPLRTASTISIAVPEIKDNRARLVGARKEVAAEVADLEEAETIICVGTGIGGPENLPVIESLARALDARIGATRRVVDQGWLSRHHQIGLTGKIVAPRLYIGVGVRGVLNHTIGIQQSGTIVAINNDPNAQVFNTADLGVVADWSEAVPALIKVLGC